MNLKSVYKKSSFKPSFKNVKTIRTEQPSATWSNQPGKIVLVAGQIAQCVGFNETPVQ